MAQVKRIHCCGTSLLRHGPFVRVRRGHPARWMTSRRIYHWLGPSTQFMHWEDQIDNLADLSSYGPHLQPWAPRAA